MRVDSSKKINLWISVGSMLSALATPPALASENFVSTECVVEESAGRWAKFEIEAELADSEADQDGFVPASITFSFSDEQDIDGRVRTSGVRSLEYKTKGSVHVAERVFTWEGENFPGKFDEKSNVIDLYENGIVECGKEIAIDPDQYAIVKESTNVTGSTYKVDTWSGADIPVESDKCFVKYANNESVKSIALSFKGSSYSTSIVLDQSELPLQAGFQKEIKQDFAIYPLVVTYDGTHLTATEKELSSSSTPFGLFDKHFENTFIATLKVDANLDLVEEASVVTETRISRRERNISSKNPSKVIQADCLGPFDQTYDVTRRDYKDYIQK